MKIGPAAREFVAESGRVRTRSSADTFISTLNHMDMYLAQPELRAVTEKSLTRWCLSGTVAPNTIKRRRAVARSFFGWCRWRGYVKVDPSVDLKYSVPAGTGRNRDHVWLSEQQAADLLAPYLSEPLIMIDQRNHIILLLGMLCGLRAGDEMAKLEWSAFSADMTKLTLVGKGRKSATIGVPPQVTEALWAWSKKAPVGARWVLPSTRHQWGNTYFDWTSPLGYDGIRKVVANAGARIGVELCPHDLRRTFAGLLEANGVPVNDISRAMRHSDVGVTAKYLDRDPKKTVGVTADLRVEPARG